MWLNVLILLLYVAVLFLITYYSRKRSSNVKDFLLGSRNIGGWLSAFAFGTTYFSTVIFVGYAGDFGYMFGLGSLFIGIGNAIVGCLLAWVLLAKRSSRMTRHFNSHTMPEFFESRYKDKYLKLITAAIVIIFLIPYSASVYKGLGELFGLVFNIDLAWIIVIMAAITAIYVFVGGYFATALTDFFQGIIMLAGVAVMVFFVYNYETVNGVVEGIQKLINDNLGMLMPGASFSKWYTLIMIVLLTSLGTFGLPQMIHKFNAVKDGAAIKRATIISTVFCLIIGVGAYFIGCAARYIVPAAEGSMRIPEMLIKALPAGVVGLILILLLSASMSTLSSITLTVGGSGAVDIYKGYIKKDAKDKSVNIVMKTLCMIVVAISALLAIFPVSTIVNLMSLSWGFLNGCFIGPYFFGLYSKRASKAGVYASVIGTIVLTTVLYTISMTVPSTAAYITPPSIGVYSMFLSLIITPLCSLFAKAPADLSCFDAIKDKNDKKALS